MQEKRLDLVSLGECLVEFSDVGENTYRASCAGDIFNSTYYASRLGLRTGIVTELGQDPFTSLIDDVLKRENIDQSMVIRSSSKGNGFYFIDRSPERDPKFYFQRELSAAREVLLDVDLQQLQVYLASSKVFLFSAIGLAVLKERDRLLDLLGSLGSTTIAMDTNFRAPLWSKVQDLAFLIEQLGAKVKLLFVTNTDDAAIFGKRTAKEALEHYKSLGYSTVVYREGKLGAHVMRGDQYHTVPAVPDIQVVDSTGAGDAFNAGFIFAILNGLGLLDAVCWGNATAACSIEEIGGIAPNFNKEKAGRYYHQLANRE
jgi:2-dehydro-3-deoxygluconokinase